MVYLFKMVIFHGYVSRNQRVNHDMFLNKWAMASITNITRSCQFMQKIYEWMRIKGIVKGFFVEPVAISGCI
jgi:hypothetical protein